jgi:hypothetical protein
MRSGWLEAIGYVLMFYGNPRPAERDGGRQKCKDEEADDSEYFAINNRFDLGVPIARLVGLSDSRSAARI